jgi:hypothetical protein
MPAAPRPPPRSAHRLDDDDALCVCYAVRDCSRAGLNLVSGAATADFAAGGAFQPVIPANAGIQNWTPGLRRGRPGFRRGDEELASLGKVKPIEDV